MKIYSQYKLFIFPLGVSLSCLTLAVFIIFPQISSLLSNQRIEKSLTDKVKILEAKAQTLENYNEEELKAKINSIVLVLPTEKDFGNVLPILQKITSEFGFVISAFSVSGGDGNTGSENYIVKLNISGSRVLFSSLLRKIESTNRLMRVQSIDISQTKDNASVEANLTIRAFFVPAPASFGSIDSPIPILSEKDKELIAKLSEFTSSSQVPDISQAPIQGPIGKANPFE